MKTTVLRRFALAAGLLLAAVDGLRAAPVVAGPDGSVQANVQRLLKERACPGCDLVGVVLNRADLRGVDLHGANLAGAKLYLADLAGADLRGANLQGAELGGADLAEADLREANLTGALLEGAYLAGARMDAVVTTARIELDEEAVEAETRVEPPPSRAKPVPYTRDLVIERRRDLGDGMAAMHKRLGVTGASTPVQLPVDPWVCYAIRGPHSPPR